MLVMKLFVFILLATFISLAVFGFFAMDFNAHQQSHACWTATAQGFSCTDFNPLAVIAFHAQAFRMFGIAVIVFFVLIVTLCVAFRFDVARFFSLRSMLDVRGSMRFVPVSIFYARWYFALRAHSPAA